MDRSFDPEANSLQTLQERVRKETRGFWAMLSLLWLVMLIYAAGAFMVVAHAQDIPRAALKHRADLVRVAHAEWGIDAPIAALAAQVHQESGWNPEAVSRVGAQGMAQFMPATTRWWCGLSDIPAAECIPSNPTWALRALVGYDRWLFDRVRGPSEFDRMWATLRAYNGGLGHWLAEAKAARSDSRQAVDAACGSARRAVTHCTENLGYPRRILLALQPRYLTWGRGVQA